MNENLTERFRSIIKSHRDSLLEWFNNSDKNETQLCLCTEEVIPSENHLTILNDIDRTLTRIENDEFGKCSVCHEDVDTELLDLDFTQEVCLDHYSEEEKRLLERDLEMAAKVQRQLLPYELPDLNGFQISVHSKSAGIVGGDYFDFFSGIDNNQGIVVGDVMGKGFPAGMLMANIQASLRILGPEHEKVNKLAERINELFRFNSKLISFISLFLAKLDTNTGMFEYCNAGHNPPLFFKAVNKEIHLLKPTGPAIGLTPNPSYNLESINLHSGDMIMLYTDGLTESRNELNEEFSQERLMTLFADYNSKSADEFLSIVKNAVKKFSNGNTHDDMTVMVLKKE
ncbi:MAG: SpoIIE family protein phosphatase [Melioribacteraceae bacterium]|nr:SpoIIE family protein phosphatase [Melioribacteraceae bacterium]